MAYGITPQGFVIKDLQTIKTELETDYRAAFGDDLDVSEDSVAGQLIGNQAKKEASLWELAQAIYESFNPDRAEDVSLDGISGLVGIERLPATSSTAVVALYGNIGTIVPAGHLIRQDETNEDFSLDEAVTIGLSSVIDIDFSVLNVLDNQLYTVTINGTGYNYTSDATATYLEIIAGLKASIDLGGEPIIVVDNLDGTARIYADDGVTAFSISVDVNLQVDSQASPGDYTAVNTGPVSVPANTLITIVNPIGGLSAVNNLVAGFAGRDVETDQELRIRRRELLTGIGAATDEAIRQAVLQEVDNVTACLVISNRSDVTDGDGRPPHSFETVVSGGDEDDIAQIIWENMPAGIYPEGDIIKTVVDSTGKDQTVRFSRPTNVYLWVDLEYSLNAEENFPFNGEDLIKDSIVEWAQENLNIGDDVIYQRISIPVYEVPGIGTIQIELATSATPAGPPGAYSAANVTIAADEIAVFAATRITVTQV